MLLAIPVSHGFARPTRNEKPELPKAYRDWIDKDVAFIITSQERDAFKKLKTNEEREQFIEMFWRRRDPDPDTDENEYREEYYERIAYANEHFSSGIPGWKSDRGRIYIMYGKPDEKETHPMGGGSSALYHGGGRPDTRLKIWFYRYLPGIGSGSRSSLLTDGQRRISHRSLAGRKRTRCSTFRAQGLTLAEQVRASPTRTDRIAGRGNANGYQRHQDSPFERLLL